MKIVIRFILLFLIVVAGIVGLSRNVNGQDSEEEILWFVKWHPDGNYLAAAYDTTGTLPGGGRDMELRILDRQLAVISTLAIPEKQSIFQLSWSSDGAFLSAIGCCQSGVQSLLIWDTSDLTSPMPIDNMPSSIFEMHDLAWSGTENRIAIASGLMVKIYDVITGSQLTTLDSGLISPFNLAWNQNGTRLAAHGSGYDGLAIWDMTNDSFTELSTDQVQSPHSNLVWSPDTDRLAVVNGSSIHILLWDDSSDRYKGEIILNQSNSFVFEIDWQGSFLAGKTVDREVIVWNTTTWEIVSRFTNTGQYPRAIALIPDGSAITYSTDSGVITIVAIP